jgi:L-ascorbate metabolism protein UlaG (beta-lactamase superfamily)
VGEVELTWLGHGSFRFDSPGGKRVYVDPWLSENPSCPETEKVPERMDVIMLTHGHPDHASETPRLWAEHGKPPVVCQNEVALWLATQDVDYNMATSGNKGGTIETDGIRFTLVDAKHSSSSADGRYLGEPCGIVVEVENGTKLYFAGDTCVFGDMALIGRIYAPDVAILPIGDHFTMGPVEAAVALELLGTKRCVPGHYGTFPLLTGTPADLADLARDVEVIALEPGETTRF